MNNRQRMEHETSHEKNGLAKDAHAGSGSTTQVSASTRQEIQGYLLIAAGILLFIYTLGYFKILNWVVMAGSVALAAYGAQKANLLEKAQDFAKRMKRK